MLKGINVINENMGSFTPKTASRAGKKGGAMSTRSTDVLGKASRKDLARLTEYGMRQAKNWLDEVAKDNPAQALKIWVQMLEYVHPKLSRREALNVAANLEITEEERKALIQKIAEAHGNG